MAAVVPDAKDAQGYEVDASKMRKKKPLRAKKASMLSKNLV
jgi:hypothetical protein